MRVAWGEGSAGRGVGARGSWQGGGMRGRPAPRTSGYRLSPVRRWGWVGGAVGVGSWGRGRPRAPPLPWVPACAGTTGGNGLGGARVMGWGDALGGDAPRAAPLDSCLRRNDGGVSGTARAAGGWGPFDRLRANGVWEARVRRGGGMRWGETPHAPPLWIPAFAGMTREGAGMTIFAGMTIGGVGDGEGCWWVGALRQAQGERGCGWRLRRGGGGGWGVGGRRPAAAPLWIPAFAGTTVGVSGTARGGGGVGALRQAQGERGCGWRLRRGVGGG